MHPINQLKSVRKAQGELAKVKRAADSLAKILTPEEAEDLRQGIAIVEGELEGIKQQQIALEDVVSEHDLLLAKLAEFVDLPEDYELTIQEEPAEQEAGE